MWLPLKLKSNTEMENENGVNGYTQSYLQGVRNLFLTYQEESCSAAEVLNTGNIHLLHEVEINILRATQKKFNY